MGIGPKRIMIRIPREPTVTLQDDQDFPNLFSTMVPGLYAPAHPVDGIPGALERVPRPAAGLTLGMFMGLSTVMR